MLVNDWTTCLCLMAVSSESIFQTPNAALSGRGERTRAAGPLGRRVGQALRTTAPLEFDQPPLSQIALDLRHRLFIRNASDVAQLPLGFRPAEAPAPRHDLLTARQGGQAEPVTETIRILSPSRLSVDDVVRLPDGPGCADRCEDGLDEVVDVGVRE